MIGDVQLLERAARAAGLPWDQWVIDGDDSWNPLIDDGDALRLAAKLYLWEPIRLAHRLVDEKTDIYDATRRAIVLAAAELADQS